MGLEDLTRYEHAVLASRFARSEVDQMYVPGALKKLKNSLDDDAQRATEIALGLGGHEQIIQTYADKYSKILEKLTVGELSTGYSKTIDNYLDKTEADKLKKEFNKFSDKTLEGINKELKKAKHILDGKDDYKYPDNEIEWAKQTKDKYKHINPNIAILENIKFEALRPNAVKKTHEELLKEQVGKI